MDANARCPDCGCYVSDHNAVNRVGDKLIAHCGGCGACWRSGEGFTALVKADIEKRNAEGSVSTDKEGE